MYWCLTWFYVNLKPESLRSHRKSHFSQSVFKLKSHVSNLQSFLLQLHRNEGIESFASIRCSWVVPQATMCGNTASQKERGPQLRGIYSTKGNWEMYFWCIIYTHPLPPPPHFPPSWTNLCTQTDRCIHMWRHTNRRMKEKGSMNYGLVLHNISNELKILTSFSKSQR